MLLDELTGPGVDLQQILDEGRLVDIAGAVARGERTGAVVENAVVAAPYLHPRKIFGIGLNYGAHASDLHEAEVRSSPASFIKGDHTIIGPGEDIVFPPHLGRVTAEAELGLVIGRECFEVSEDAALSYVAGVVAVLDQTAEEVLLENPRYLGECPAVLTTQIRDQTQHQRLRITQGLPPLEPRRDSHRRCGAVVHVGDSCAHHRICAASGLNQ